MDEHTFLTNRERAVDYLNSLEKVRIIFLSYTLFALDLICHLLFWCFQLLVILLVNALDWQAFFFLDKK